MVPAAHSVVPALSIDRPWCAESLTYCSRGMSGTRLGRGIDALHGAAARLGERAGGVVDRTVGVGRLRVELDQPWK